MQKIGQIAGALLGGIALFGLAIGAILMTMAEGASIPLPTPIIPTPTLIPTSLVFLPTPDPALVSTSTPILTPTTTATVVFPTSISCSHPGGWSAVIVQPGDTLESLASRYRTTAIAIKSGNCLVVDVLPPGSVIYLPTPPTAVNCGPLPGWVTYIVKPGDTLYHLAWRYQTRVELLQLANCLGNSYGIRAGEALYVPRVTATLTVSPTVTATVTETATVSPTSPPTLVATISATAGPSNTPIPPTPTTPPAPTDTPPAPGSATP